MGHAIKDKDMIDAGSRGAAMVMTLAVSAAIVDFARGKVTPWSSDSEDDEGKFAETRIDTDKLKDPMQFTDDMFWYMMTAVPQTMIGLTPVFRDMQYAYQTTNPDKPWAQKDVQLLPNVAVNNVYTTMMAAINFMDYVTGDEEISRKLVRASGYTFSLIARRGLPTNGLIKLYDATLGEDAEGFVPSLLDEFERKYDNLMENKADELSEEEKSGLQEGRDELTPAKPEDGADNEEVDTDEDETEDES
jgi:hypothetical protein